MPSFTLPLWQVIELKPYDVDEDTYLGLSEYPIFDEAYRESLNKKIKDHFMYQEIGHETVAQFTFSMKRKLNEVMPLFNDLYKSQRLEYDPLSTMDIKTVSDGTAIQTSEGTSNSETSGDVDAKTKNVSSAFPQVQLAGNKDYATSGADGNSQTKTKGAGAESSSASNEATSETNSRTSGYQGNVNQLLMSYRAALLNVDMLVIGELEDLFMIAWNNGDDYTTTQRWY